MLITSLGWADRGKMDQHLQEKAQRGDRLETVSVIVQTDTPPDDEHIQAILAAGGKVKRSFSAINGIVIDVPVKALDDLAKHPRITRLSHDFEVRAHNYITNETVGADVARINYGVNGAGIGVAVLDTGLASQMNDITHLMDGSVRTIGWVDFVKKKSGLYEDNGHGTHVAGIIGGSGRDSRTTPTPMNGIAPNVTLVGVKVLDQYGRGSVSNVILGLQWCIQNKSRYNIRVINLSLGHPVAESYTTDPLTQACEAAVKAGIVVVVAAGNYGKDSLGNIVYGGITSPGNDPMVVTVGATKTLGTPYRSDDTVAGYSSRGPTYIDQLAKPDLVVPGNRTISVAANNSYLYNTYPANQVIVGQGRYSILSGTSMATPVVSGTVALLLQVNPTLTPNLVKAILMYTAQDMGLDRMTQGAGYLNAVGALNLAANIAQSPTTPGAYWIINGGLGLQTTNLIQGQNVVWGTGFIWGSNVVWGTAVYYNYLAWTLNVVWGSNVVWGGNIVWGGNTVTGTNVVWGSNVVWSDATWVLNAPPAYETLINGE